MHRSVTWAVVWAVLATGSARAAEAGLTDLVRATLLADTDAATPGGSFTLGVKLKMKEHWHTYWAFGGDAGDPTKVTLTGPAGFEFGAIQWPLPHRIEIDGVVSYGYENEVMLLIPVKVSSAASTGGKATIEAEVEWLACKDTCIEGGAKLSLTLPVAVQASPANAQDFAAWCAALPAAADRTGMLAKVEQAADGAGAPLPSLTVTWQTAPRKVEWFPVANSAVGVEDVAVKHEGRQTRITYKPTVYKADQVAGGQVEGVLVYEDAQGRRHGVWAPARVLPGK